MGGLHCWMGYTEWVEEAYGVRHWWEAPAEVIAPVIGDGERVHDATCLLPAGHEGPHEWTPDGDITITFPPPVVEPA